MDLFSMFRMISTAGGGSSPAPPSGADYVVTGNQSTAGEYALAETWPNDSGVTKTGNYNGYPVYYCASKNTYLYYYWHFSGGAWSISANSVYGMSTPASSMGMLDYCTTDKTSPTLGAWNNGSVVTAA